MRALFSRKINKKKKIEVSGEKTDRVEKIVDARDGNWFAVAMITPVGYDEYSLTRADSKLADCDEINFI